MWSGLTEGDDPDGREGPATPWLSKADAHEAVGTALDAQRAVRVGGLTSKVADFRPASSREVHDLGRQPWRSAQRRLRAGGSGEAGGVHAARAASGSCTTALRLSYVQQRTDSRSDRSYASGQPRPPPGCQRPVDPRRPFPTGLWPEVINALAHSRDAIACLAACGDSLRGARVVPQVSGRLFVQLGDLCAQVRLHDSEDIHRGAGTGSLFRKFNGHTPR